MLQKVNVRKNVIKNMKWLYSLSFKNTEYFPLNFIMVTINLKYLKVNFVKK